MSTGGVSKERSLAALAAATDRLAALLDSLDPGQGGEPIPHLDWTVAETAAHVVTVAGRLLGDRRRSAPGEDAGGLNALCLEEFAERDVHAIADRLRADM